VADRSLQRRFGEVVRKFRQAIGISQEELADRAGLHRTYISLLERGLRTPSLTVIAQLATALETTSAELVAAAERGHGASR
jgi:transcriptional regulator with XRE-family HTH domain